MHRSVFLSAVFSAYCLLNVPAVLAQVGRIWQAPADADTLRNPFSVTTEFVERGRATYDVLCWTCHGDFGRGDGPAATGTLVPPTDLTHDSVQVQTGGALFWKITAGNGPMPPFGGVLSEEERWELVAYLRQLPRLGPPTPPRPLRADVQVELFAQVAANGIRLKRDPVSGNLYYNTYEGDVYEIRLSEDGEPAGVQIATAEDHGITRLQGMAFLDSTLFLVGNVSVNEGKGTRGITMRGRLIPTGERVWSNVFLSDEFGTTRTTFDHGFNAVVVSPDERYLLVNSGSRTDHGEVQDNDGAYPGQRDVPLTAAVFRIPIDTRDLRLRNDARWLREQGYLYADGIRNAYDMAFDSKSRLFAVSNSGDYDHPEDMFWVREGRHYGFPWVMGGIENPQQHPDFEPDPETDPFINARSHAYVMRYFHNDPDFPPRPAGMTFTPPVANVGPDANYFRDPKTGRILKGDEVGVAVGTFTAHRSPLGLVFDVDSLLAPEFRGDGFVLSWTHGARSSLLGRLERLGSDLKHLRLFFSPDLDNFVVQTTRIVDGFNGPTDALLLGNELYVIEYGSPSGNVWKVILPEEIPPALHSGPPR